MIPTNPAIEGCSNATEPCAYSVHDAAIVINQPPVDLAPIGNGIAVASGMLAFAMVASVVFRSLMGDGS